MKTAAIDAIEKTNIDTRNIMLDTLCILIIVYIACTVLVEMVPKRCYRCKYFS